MLISKENKKFSSSELKSLNSLNGRKCYVYGLIDPDMKPIGGFEIPFYIGKGSGNRVFNHIDDARALLSKRTNITADL